ncbi:MAG: RagB/SusD family nutrient uptake outer membrane protein [Bacteroidales bacterium]|nr:RagB/SusD family nutrient uptake outer membrane protein [Bacteroidales bacterium]
MKALHKLLIVLGMAGALTATSCTDLKEHPYDFLTDDTLDFTDPQTIAEMSGNVYSFLRSTFWQYYGMWDWTEDAADLHLFPSRIGVGWGDYYIAYHKHQFSPSLNNINYVIWYHAYVAIMYANQCLGNETFRSSNPQSVAELRALRAYLYYILFDSYRNIPILPEEDQPAGFLPEQEKPDVTFQYIVDELEAAEKDLPETNFFGFPTKAMAWMTLAKMHLNYYAWFADKEPYDEGDKSHYEEALKWADKIIKCGLYSLSPNYKDNHVVDLSGNKEVIFALNMEAGQASGSYLANANLPSFGTAAFGFSGGWNGGCAVPQFIDTYAHRPATPSRANHMTGVEYLDTRFYDTWAYGQQYVYGSNDRVKLDPASVDEQGPVDVFYTKEVHSVDTPGAYMLEGYRYVKGEIQPNKYHASADDTPIYRLADAYFIAAECALRLGGSKTLPEYSEQKAADLVTAVRERAFRDTDPSLATRTVAQLKGGSVYDYGVREYTAGASGDAEIDAAEPKSPAFTYEEVWNDPLFIKTQEGGADIQLGGLLDDLAWEFVGEFHRRQDLIRFQCGNGQNVWNGKSWLSKRAEQPGVMYKNLYPICVQNMESNIKLVQNPGYPATSSETEE